MKPRDVFGPYGTRPTDLHGDWYKLSFHARLIGMELIALCKDPGELRLPVGDDWRDTLCFKMAVSGPDRRNAKAALDKLVEAGFLHPEPGFVRVTLDPVRSHFGSTSVPVRIHSGSTPDPKPTQVAENTNVESPPNYLPNKLASERAPAHTRDVGEDRAELIGFRFVASLLGRSTFDISPVGAYTRQYAWIGSKSPPEREAVRLAVEADEWCRTNPHKVDAPHLERRWQHYLHGDAKPVLKPVVAPKPEPRGIWAKAAAP